MHGHIVLNCLYQKKVHQVSQVHRNVTGEITHVSIFPVHGKADEINEIKVPISAVDLRQVA